MRSKIKKKNQFIFLLTKQIEDSSLQAINPIELLSDLSGSWGQEH